MAKKPTTTPAAKRTAPALTNDQVAERAKQLDEARAALGSVTEAAAAAQAALEALPADATDAMRSEAQAAVDLARLAVTDAEAKLKTIAGEPSELPPASKPPRLPRSSIDTLLGSSTLPALIAIGDRQVQLGDIVAAAHLASGLSLEDWNALEGEVRDEWLLNEIAERRRVAPSKPSNPEPEPVATASLPAGNGRQWVTVIGPVKGRRRAGRVFSAEPTSIEVDAAELEELRSDPALAVTTGMAVAGPAGNSLGRRLAIDDVSFPSSGKVTVKVLGPTRGRRRAGFEFNASAQAVSVDADQLALILGDSELAVLPA